MARGLIDRALRLGEAKQFKDYEKRVEAINRFEAEMELLDDAEIRAEADELRERARERRVARRPPPRGLRALPRGQQADARPAPLRRPADRRHGPPLRRDRGDEDRRGQDPDRDASPSSSTRSAGDSVHVVTVNDYLARRDAEWMEPLYSALGVSVGVLQDNDLPDHGDRRHAAYAADVTYGTNSEFGFDYLRDNMAPSLERCFQRDHKFAIVDEVDNILIDEARTPLIISGSPEAAADLYYTFARLAKSLEGVESKPKLKALGESKDTSEAEYDYEYDEKHKTVAPTERGVEKAEKFLGVENLYLSEHGTLVNHLIQSLKAESLYRRDKDYAVVDGEVMIIDEHTGRILEGRRWSEGLHQAVEAKEGLAIREENQTLATITLQNYFRFYEKLSGMTGTALTEATEFMKIYKMPVVEIPTNRDMVRDDANDQIYKTKDGKWKAVVNEIAERHETGQPILVGTVSVEVSEMLSEQFKQRGIEHEVLNAKPEYAQKEGETVAQAGPPRRGHDRDQHGRPRRRHQARRRPRAARRGRAPQARRQARRRELRGGARGADARARGALQGRGRAGPRGRRPVHLRHRAPRVAPDRQPASRPRRPPGRPRRLPLLPLRPGRSRPPLRRRPDLQDPRSPRPDRRRGRGVPARGEDAQQADRERPEEGRGAELPEP